MKTPTQNPTFHVWWLPSTPKILEKSVLVVWDVVTGILNLWEFLGVFFSTF
jgi:hypothetical protein